MPAKRKIKTGVPLPSLNWVPLKAIKNTVFESVDDESVFKVLDMQEFERLFQAPSRGKKGALLGGGAGGVGGGGGHGGADGGASEPDSPGVGRKQEAKKTVLEGNRARTVLIAKKHLSLPFDQLRDAVVALDVGTLTLDTVELLSKLVPKPEEEQALAPFKEKGGAELSDADAYMLNLLSIPQLARKLTVMRFMDEFKESLESVERPMEAIIATSSAMKTSAKVRKLFEVLLALGNYMNSSKRGGAHGFKVNALDRVCDMRSPDKSTSLLRYLDKASPLSSSMSLLCPVLACVRACVRACVHASACTL